MKNVRRKPCCQVLKQLLVVALVGVTAPLWAEEVFVTSYKGTAASTDAVPCPPNGGSCGVNVSLFGSSASSSVNNPTPVIPGSSRRIIYSNVQDPSSQWAVTPMDISYTGTTAGSSTFTSLQHVPGVYRMYITRGSGTTTHSTNLVMAVTVSTNAANTLADTNGVGQTTMSVPFTRSSAVNSWIFIGYLTNQEASPTITFAYQSGTVDNSNNRWNMDAVRFEYYDPCSANNFAPEVDPTGPLAAGQNYVNVGGVAANASSVTVFANGVQIGTTNLPGGFAGGTVAVPTTQLNMNDVLTSQQVKSNCTSFVPPSAAMVGGGSNPKIKAFISCYKNSALTGPIGANGTAAGNPYIVKGTGLSSGFNTAPLGGQELLPSQCWQSVTFDIVNDSKIDINSGGAVTESNPFCALDGLVFSLDDADSGPYDIYVDRIVNGSTVIENFEGYAPGSIKTFIAANLAGSFGGSGQFLSQPCSSTVSTNNALDGTNACRIQWQWLNNDTRRWARIVASGGSSGKVYPQIDTSKPVTVYYLLLPVGQTTNNFHFSSLPADRTAAVGGSTVFSVGAVGTAPIVYQWSKGGVNLSNGGNINGSTTANLTVSSLSLSDAGTYSVSVTDNNSCNATNNVALNVVSSVPPSNLTSSYTRPNLTLTWGAGVLQKTAVLLTNNTPWVDVSSNSPFVTNASSGTSFFRLRGTGP